MRPPSRTARLATLPDRRSALCATHIAPLHGPTLALSLSLSLPLAAALNLSRSISYLCSLAALTAPHSRMQHTHALPPPPCRARSRAAAAEKKNEAKPPPPKQNEPTATEALRAPCNVGHALFSVVAVVAVACFYLNIRSPSRLVCCAPQAPQPATK